MTHAPSRIARLSAAFALGALLTGVGLVAAPQQARAATFTVTTTSTVVDAGSCAGLSLAALPGADGVVSLPEAVCVANSTSGADIISLPAGAYALTTPLEITDEITIVGAGIGATTIDASATDRAIDAWAGSGVTLQQMTIVGGDSVGSGLPDGAAVSSFYVPLLLDNVRVTGGRAESGGGIWALGQVVMFESIVDGNAATVAGGGAVVIGVLQMQRSTIADNVAPDGAGLVLESDDLDVSTIEQSTFSGNAASVSGGGILVSGFHRGQTVVTDSTFVGNTAVVSGGGLHSAGSAVGELFLSSTTVTGNTAAAGAGVAQLSGTVIIENSVIAENVGGDVQGVFGPSSGFNLVGVSGGGFVDGVDGNQVGSAAAPLSPRLRAIGDFGGPTRTRVPLPGSPVIDAGDNCGAVDQRLETRVVCDIGAVELTAAPDTTITSGPASSTTDADANFAFAASGGAGGGGFECSLDDGAYTPCAGSSTFSVASGIHTLRVRAIDELGATDASAAQWSWTAETGEPELAVAGTESAIPGGVAAGAVLLGGLLVLAARRERAMRRA